MGSKGKGIRQYGAVALWAMACFAFFQFCYPYHFFYQEQNQLFLMTWEHAPSYLPKPGWAARLMGDFLTQFYYYLVVGPLILTLSLLTLGDVTRRFLQRVLQECNLHKHRDTFAFTIAIIMMTLFAVFSFRHDYRLSNIISAIGIMGGLWICSFFPTEWKNATFKIFSFIIIIPIIWLFGWPKMGKLALPNFYLEKQLAVDNEYYFGHYDRVIDLVEGEKSPTPEMKFFYNLVQAGRQELPNVLLKFIPNELGTFYKIGPETPMLTIKNMNELYWALGDMTFTERAAMMGNVFSPDNRNVRMVKRLAEANMVSGDTAAMNKYLRLLGKTWAYKKLALSIPNNRKLMEKRAFTNRQDTLQVSDNLHMVMMELLDSNPQNTIALHYLLCSDLLLKDMETFKRDYDRYCIDKGNEPHFDLFQEALCIYLAGTQAKPEEWSRYIHSQHVLNRFAQYNVQRGSKQFRDTYWYYFDTAKAPQP